MTIHPTQEVKERLLKLSSHKWDYFYRVVMGKIPFNPCFDTFQKIASQLNWTLTRLWLELKGIRDIEMFAEEFGRDFSNRTGLKKQDIIFAARDDEVRTYTTETLALTLNRWKEKSRKSYGELHLLSKRKINQQYIWKLCHGKLDPHLESMRKICQIRNNPIIKLLVDIQSTARIQKVKSHNRVYC